MVFCIIRTLVVSSTIVKNTNANETNAIKNCDLLFVNKCIN